MLVLLLTAAVAALLLIVVRVFARDPAPTKNSLRHIPELRFEKHDTEERYVSESRNLLLKGYDQYLRNGIPFQMRNPVPELGPQVFLPLKYLDEIKTAPTSLFSFEVFSEKLFLLNYSDGPHQTKGAAQVIRVDLNRNLGKLATGMYCEAIAALDAKVTSSDWTTFPAYETLSTIATQVNSYALVGPSLCRDPRWIQISLQCVMIVFGAAKAIRDNYTPRWRWLARWQSDAPAQLRAMRAQAVEMLRPLYKERKDALNSKASQDDEAHLDCVNWLLQLKNSDTSIEKIADQELFLAIASTHTTSATLTSILFDLLAHPQSQDELRAEVNEALEECGGKWTLQRVAQMKKMDSFMKESNRLNPIGFIAGQRIAVKAHTFNDGLHLPAGTVFQFAADAIHHDSAYYPDPYKFDAKRFARMREAVDPNRFHFASVSDTSLSFGAGTHACPGRFLTAITVKMILVVLLTKYEVKLGGEDDKRPANLFHHFNLRPDPTTTIMLKRRV
ncbi:cytochrome P450 [Nemania sp. FL0916]|nr:cytochrome P450 [Nemania sp. FL0916]